MSEDDSEQIAERIEGKLRADLPALLAAATPPQPAREVLDKWLKFLLTFAGVLALVFAMHKTWVSNSSDLADTRARVTELEKANEASARAFVAFDKDVAVRLSSIESNVGHVRDEMGMIRATITALRDTLDEIRNGGGM